MLPSAHEPVDLFSIERGPVLAGAALVGALAVLAQLATWLAGALVTGVPASLDSWYLETVVAASRWLGGGVAVSPFLAGAIAVWRSRGEWRANLACLALLCAIGAGLLAGLVFGSGWGLVFYALYGGVLAGAGGGAVELARQLLRARA